ncbi:hypothetical protein ACSRUE_20880 [Sorangium sp. KYC3313]|uniref:hypothetical protein n=1 Tax=Sorangium sp. KYC3313 TaxID=3449740 RepID=UPI003F8C1DAA
MAPGSSGSTPAAEILPWQLAVNVSLSGANTRTSSTAAIPENAGAAPVRSKLIAWSALDRAVDLVRLGRFVDARVAACELAAILPAAGRDPRAVVSRLTADQSLVDDLVEALALAGLG